MRNRENDLQTFKLVVRISLELNEKIDLLCRTYGMSKSSLCAYYLGKMVDQEMMLKNSLSTEGLQKIFSNFLPKETNLMSDDVDDLQLPFDNELE